MPDIKEIITLNREVCLNTPSQPSITAVITRVENNIFWINLPRRGNQVLVLQENQKLSIRLTTPDGTCMAETTVDVIGKDHDMFYGLAIPDRFSISQQRKYIRIPYNANVFFQSENMSAQTKLVNFSAGGVMVYMDAQLNQMLKTNKKITLYFSIDNTPFIIDVREVWTNTYNNIEYAGFEFQQISEKLQQSINQLAIKYSKVEAVC